MNALTPAAPDARADQARAWACARLALADAAFEPASADASFRRYFRLASGGRSWIVMDAPPAHEDCGPFLAVAALLRRWRLHAPEILAHDPAAGFVLMSDLGTRTYLEALTPANADRLYGCALEALLRMQVAARDEPQAMAFLPRYDDALLWREIRLFPDWYLPRHLGCRLPADEARALEGAMARIVEAALAQPATFVHRDYMPRNLMVSDPDPGILDFQDAVAGPVTYDVISLFKDAFVSWPEARVDGWLRQHWRAARAAGLAVPPDPEAFRRQADWMGLHRHLKVLGIFARLTYRDGKPRYVADTPRFVRYVMDVAPRYAELAPLVALFERRVLPQVPR